MPSFRRTFPSYIAPPCYATSSVPTKLFGHSPIAINLLAFAPWWWDETSFGSLSSPATGDFQLWYNGAATGPLVTLTSGSGYAQALDTPIAVPAVIEANVDTTSRFGIRAPAGERSKVAIAYEVANAADTGKCIMGVGSDTLCVASPGDSSGFFSPVTFGSGLPGAPTNASGSDVFNFRYESSAPSIAGSTQEIAVVPLAVSCEFADFTFVDRSGSGPGGAVSLVFRVNGEDTIHIDLTATSQRVWYPTGDTSLVVPAGSLICLQQQGSGDIDGEFLFTCRAFDEGGGVLGMGESFGEF